MAVEVKSRSDRRMPKPLLRDLRMYPGEQQLRRVAMTKVMETDAREVNQSSEEARELMGQALRL